MQEILRQRQYIYAALGISLGLILLIWGLNIYFEQAQFKRKYTPNTARVVGRKTLPTGKHYPVIAFITYDDSSKVYFHAKHLSAASYPVGEVVKIYYDEINPSDTHLAGNEWFSIIFLNLTGAVFLLWGLVLLATEWRRRRLIHWLKQNGKAVKAHFQSLGEETSLNMGNFHAYFVFCQWHDDDPATPIFTFKSELFFLENEPQIAQGQGISVFLHPKNQEKYHVDLSFL